MSVDAFLSHIRSGSPTFRCYACGDAKETLKLDTSLVHRLNEPADLNDIHLIREFLPRHADDFVDFFAEHNGCTLYCDRRGDAEGFEMYPVAEWESRTANVKRQFAAMGWEPDECPVGISDALAFGEIPHSANYFTVKTSGADAGSIYYVDHDDFRESPFAESFPDLLARIVADPAQFLYDVGCYTRYSDGKTKTQWIPKIYQDDHS